MDGDRDSAPEWCPGCGSANLRPVIAGEAVNLLCRECGSCWHIDAGVNRRVDPRACPGCPSRPVCIRRLWERDHRLVSYGYAQVETAIWP